MKKRTAPNLIFWVCYVAYTAIYLSRVNLTMAAPALKETALLDAAQIGVLGGVFSVIYAFGRMFNGWLSDRLSPRRMIPVGLLLCGAANLLVGLLPPYPAFLLLWGINAYAQSMLWSSNLRLLAALHDEEEAQRRASWLITSVSAGNLAGILLSGHLVSDLGVRWAFLVPGGFTLLCFAAALLTLPDVSPARTAEKSSGPVQLLCDTAAVFIDRRIRRMVVPTLCLGIMKDNISLWMAVYVVDTFGIDLRTSSWYVLLIPAVGLVGRLLYPFCYRISGHREQRVAAVSYAVCFLFSILLLLFVPSPLAAVVWLSVVYAANSLISTAVGGSFPLRFLDTGNVATVSGLLDLLVYSGAALSSLIFGFAIRAFGYAVMFAVWVAVSALSALLLLRNATLHEKGA